MLMSGATKFSIFMKHCKTILIVFFLFHYREPLVFKGLLSMKKLQFLSYYCWHSCWTRHLLIYSRIAGTLLILSVFAIKVVLVDKRKGNEKFSIIALYTYEFGFGVFALLLPLLVYAVSLPGAIIISIIEIGWAVIFVVYKLSNYLQALKP